MPLLKPRKNRQEKIATFLFAFFITAPMLLLILPKNNMTIIIVFTTMIISGFTSAYLKRKYGTWRQQYQVALSELGYFKIRDEHGTLGVFRKDNTDYTLFLMRKGVMAIQL